jgi:hypothetical protein
LRDPEVVKNSAQSPRLVLVPKRRRSARRDLGGGCAAGRFQRQSVLLLDDSAGAGRHLDQRRLGQKHSLGWTNNTTKMTALEDIGIWVEFIAKRHLTKADEEVLKGKLDHWLAKQKHEAFTKCATKLSEALNEKFLREEFLQQALIFMGNEANKLTLAMR